MEALTRIKRQIDAYETSIQTCGADDRPKVLGLLAEQFCEVLAELSEDMTGEPGNGVYGCAENLIDEIGVMFRDAADRAERVREESGFRPRHPYSTHNVTQLGLSSGVAVVR